MPVRIFLALSTRTLSSGLFLRSLSMMLTCVSLFKCGHERPLP